MTKKVMRFTGENIGENLLISTTVEVDDIKDFIAMIADYPDFLAKSLMDGLVAEASDILLAYSELENPLRQIIETIKAQTFAYVNGSVSLVNMTRLTGFSSLMENKQFTDIDLSKHPFCIKLAIGLNKSQVAGITLFMTGDTQPDEVTCFIHFGEFIISAVVDETTLLAKIKNPIDGIVYNNTLELPSSDDCNVFHDKMIAVTNYDQDPVISEYTYHNEDY